MGSETYDVHNHVLTNLLAEDLKEFFPEDGDISCEEFLQQQECFYQSIQANGNGRNKKLTSEIGETSNKSLSLERAGEFSHGANVESQLELDEALARSLQELGEDFDDFYISQFNGSAAESRDPPPQATPARVISPNNTDDVDPNNMTYEELQSLGESVGHVSRGLPDESISRLPTFKYKTGLFSKKRIKEECSICCDGYTSGARLITLPCAHRYHSECITRWLKLNKVCPVCQKEVQVE